MKKHFGSNMHSIWDIIFSSLVLILYALTKSTESALSIGELQLPDVADVRDTLNLGCFYNVTEDKLHSIKFYKDGSEFFRYVPSMEPEPRKVFPVSGVHITSEATEECRTAERCRITLDNLSVESSGVYRCEVSGDAPTFHLAFKETNITIIALPRHDPVISGLGFRYEIGEFVVANCTTDSSYPPAILSWYINDQKVPPIYLQPQRERIESQDGFQLYVRSLEIRFRLEPHLFQENSARIKLKCVARIKEVYSATRESVVTIFAPSMDQLSNQKLINWPNAGVHHRKCVSVAIVLISSIFISFNL